MRAAAREVDSAIKLSLRADTGDGRLSNMGNALLTTKTTYTGRGSFVVADITPGSRSRGAWAILQRGTRPHVIRPRARRRYNVLAIGGNVITGGVAVSGSPAKRTWTNGTARGEPAARRSGTEAWRATVNGR